jgi:hypothetical protein
VLDGAMTLCPPVCKYSSVPTWEMAGIVEV